MYRFIAGFYPKKIRESLINLLAYSGIRIDPKKFIGFTLVFGFLFSLVIGFGIGFLIKKPFLPLFVVSFFLFEMIVYLRLVLSTDKKGRFVESVLPDALQLMSSNLRAGLTTDKALLLSARPEFGPFKDEINMVGKEIAMGKQVDKALLDMTKRIKSKKLERTMELIASGIRSGGELAALLDQTASDLRNQEIVDRKVRASVNMYIIFIFVAAGLVAPILFGLSSFLSEIITTSITSIDVPSTVTSSPMKMTPPEISIGFIINFIVTLLITTSILASLILGLISTGKEKGGIKFILPLLVISIPLFFIVRYGIKNMLGGLFGF
ncbi:MAG: type II secretion system F family protein [Nanoarchaeota archaeon]|nr:type II secretion system F family protein [Nanoarchaeota archaeon]